MHSSFTSPIVRMWKGIFVLCTVLKLSSFQVIDITSIDTIIGSNNKNLIAKESNLVKVLSSCNASFTFSISNLKSVSIASDLTTAMSNAMTIIRQFQTTKNFEKFQSFIDPTVCDYFAMRMATLKFDAKDYQITLEAIARNTSRLYEQVRLVYWNYGVYFRKLQDFWTREQSVFVVFRSITRVFNEYWSFIGLLKANLAYSQSLHDYLKQTYPTANCPVVTCNIKSKGDPIEADLVKAQQELVALEVTAQTKVQAALKVVTASTAVGPNDSPTKKKLIDLDNVFEKHKTADDYDVNICWPRVPDTTEKGEYRTLMSL